MHKERTTKSLAGLLFMLLVAAGAGLLLGMLIIPSNVTTTATIVNDTVSVVDTVIITKEKEVIKYFPPTIKTIYKTIVDTIIMKDTVICIDTLYVCNKSCTMHQRKDKYLYIHKFRQHRYPEHGPLWELDSIKE